MQVHWLIAIVCLFAGIGIGLYLGIQRIKGLFLSVSKGGGNTHVPTTEIVDAIKDEIKDEVARNLLINRIRNVLDKSRNNSG